LAQQNQAGLLPQIQEAQQLPSWKFKESFGAIKSRPKHKLITYAINLPILVQSLHSGETIYSIEIFLNYWI
jgi:hypothetical protein